MNMRNLHGILKQMNSARGIALAVLFMFMAQQSPAQDSDQSGQSEFDRMVEEQNRQFDEFTDRMEQDWRAWVVADSLAFSQFRGEVEAKWGSYNGTTRKDWVEYDENKDSRTAVDFEKGEAVVEVLVPATSDADAGLDQLREAVNNLVEDRGKTMDYPVLDQAPRPLGNQPVLENQLADTDGNVVDAGNARQFAEQVVQERTVTKTPIKSPDGVSRVKVSVAIPLVPRHLRVRAEHYVDNVKAMADRYDLDTRVVLAMIHTESYFNPKAKSHIPAYGLMQLVPRYGGKDAYKAVHGNDEMPSPNYLYDPRNNIELGCAYMNIVLNQYLKRIENDLSRLYCAICAYNTGAGNVSKAFTGKSRVSTAAAIINEMTPDDVLAKLKRDLPYDETKDYITRILDRVKYYEEWKN